MLLVRHRLFAFAAYQQRLGLIEPWLPTKAKDHWEGYMDAMLLI